MILYLAADLIWATRIKGAAEAVGVQARPVRSVEMLEARLAEYPGPGRIKALIVDLDASEAALAMVGRLRGPDASPTERVIRVLAFGPHVAVELFAAVKKAGADVVMARGAFGGRLPEVIGALAADEGGGPG